MFLKNNSIQFSQMILNAAEAEQITLRAGIVAIALAKHC